MAEWKFIGARRYECSVCGEGIVEMPCDWASEEPLYNFCPYCGANMNIKKADGRYEPQSDDIIVRSNVYPFRVVEADLKTENCSEKPNKCDTCRWGEWYRKGYDITMMSDECGGCCSWNNKWTPKDEPQTDCAWK